MLYERFEMLATHKDIALNERFMTEQDFKNIEELRKNPLGERLIEAFFAVAEYVFKEVSRFQKLILL